MSWDGIEISEKNAPLQVRILRGRWPLPGRCTFCSRPIVIAIALIVTPIRIGVICNRCGYAPDIAARLAEIACRYGHVHQIALPDGGWA